MCVKRIGIVGAGIMGRGIAEIAAFHGFDVALIDLENEMLNNAIKTIEKNLQKRVRRDELSTVNCNKILQKIHLSTDLTDLGESQLVIEAVPENKETKKRVLIEIEQICTPETILASNTSSISISWLSSSLSYPEKLVGLHFFNPVPKMKLVEVIRGNKTLESVIETVCRTAEKIDKVPVLVEDRPGFIVNRLLIPLINDAAEILTEGIASPQDIDTAMKLGANYPIGPLELADLIGIDTCLAIMVTLSEELNHPRYQPHALLFEMVKRGHLGKKSGNGFYEYPQVD